MKPLRRFTVLAALLLVAGMAFECAGTGAQVADDPPSAIIGQPREKVVEPGMARWQSEHFRDHPLVGRIWSVREEGWIDQGELSRALARARFVLLGESHDNPDHHELQRRLLAGILDGGRRPAVAFEMIDADRQAAIDRAIEAGGCADAIGASVEWDRRWGGWPMYRPLLKAARDASAPIIAANLPSSQAKALVRQGLEGLPREEVDQLSLARPLAPEVEAAMRREMMDSHCGHLPESMAGGMVLAQRARDARMAERLVASATDDGAVLIAGAGHVRTDRGVPPLLRELLGETEIAALAFIEVTEDEDDLRAYGEVYGAGNLPFDYVWFTPRFSVEDPCEAFRSMRR